MFDYHRHAQQRSAHNSPATSKLTINCPSGSYDEPAGSSPGGASSRGFRRASEPFIIGVAGGTASGKTTVCDQIIQR